MPAGEFLVLNSSDMGRFMVRPQPLKYLLEAGINHRERSAYANVTRFNHLDYAYIAGHKFGDKIVVPGVLQLAATSDLLGLYVLSEPSIASGRTVLPTRIEGQRFKGVINPGDLLTAELHDVQTHDYETRARGVLIKHGGEKSIVSEGTFVSQSFEKYDIWEPKGELLERVTKPTIIVAGEDELDKYLPQKPPFRFVDSFSVLEPGQRGVGFFVGSESEALSYASITNLDGRKAVHRMLVLEGLAQVGTAIALSVPENSGKVPLFGGIKSLEFLNFLEVGQMARLELEVTGFRQGVGRGTGRAIREDGAVILQTTMTFAVVDPAQL